MLYRRLLLALVMVMVTISVGCTQLGATRNGKDPCVQIRTEDGLRKCCIALKEDPKHPGDRDKAECCTSVTGDGLCIPSMQPSWLTTETVAQINARTKGRYAICAVGEARHITTGLISYDEAALSDARAKIAAIARTFVLDIFEKVGKLGDAAGGKPAVTGDAPAPVPSPKVVAGAESMAVYLAAVTSGEVNDALPIATTYTGDKRESWQNVLVCMSEESLGLAVKQIAQSSSDEVSKEELDNMQTAMDFVFGNTSSIKDELLGLNPNAMGAAAEKKVKDLSDSSSAK